MTQPLILITNDDGIEAPGLDALRQAMEPLGEVLVVAPDEQKSATSHAITIFRDIAYREERRNGEIWAHVISGHPADCVKLGVLALAPRKPDLLVAGINPGSNIGNNILYSGTVAAAREGAMLGIPSIAVSMDYKRSLEQHPCYATGGQWAAFAAGRCLREGLPRGVCLNVNVPNLPPGQVTEATITRQGTLMFIDDWRPQAQEEAAPHAYRNVGTEVILEGEDHEPADDVALRQGKVSITPLHFDHTCYALLDALQSWLR